MTPAQRQGTSGSGIALMLLAMLCIACNDAVGKHLSQSYSIWQILWLRSCIWIVIAWIWVARRGGVRQALVSHRPVLQGARSLLLVAEVCVFIIALRYLPLAEVSAISAASPLVVLVLAVLVLDERVGRHRWTAVLVGMAGMLIVARPGAGVFGWLTLLPVLGVLMWGVYQVLLRLVSRHDSAETTLLWTAIIMFLVTGAVAPWHWQAPADAGTWMWFVLVGVFNATGHLALIWAMQRAEASALQPFSYTAVAWAIAIGWAAFGDWPDGWTLTGAALIVAGGLYALHRERVRA